MSMLTTIDTKKWDFSYTKEIKNLAINSLEQGNILLFPELNFSLLPHEKKFLSPRYSNQKAKNISFNSSKDTLSGVNCTPNEYHDLKNMLARFSQSAYELVQQILPSYVSALNIGRTSYRPVEISGRVSSYRKDDTRLHVDAFPATPNQGLRILRVFSNINPNGQDRIWRVGEPFLDVATRFLPEITKYWRGKSTILQALKITKTFRTEYDHIMLNIHDRMKKDLHYQKAAKQAEIRFAPKTTWIVQTDHVSHAAMSGQYLLEQTFYLPVSAMANPDYSPLRTLEKLTKRDLI